jgi:prepilin-type N-terminal cleavage/methylation domain-containing protein
MEQGGGVRGVTLIEVLVVIVMLGIVTAILVPRFRVSPQTRVRHAADQLVRDLELARGRALSTRSWSRVRFDVGTSSYTGFLDFNRDSVFAMSAEETDSLHGFHSRTLSDNVAFGRGAAPDVPGVPGAAIINFPGAVVDFDARGLTNPFGTKGVIYLSHPGDPNAIAAVTVTGGAGIRAWLYDGTTWR